VNATRGNLSLPGTVPATTRRRIVKDAIRKRQTGLRAQAQIAPMLIASPAAMGRRRTSLDHARLAGLSRKNCCAAGCSGLTGHAIGPRQLRNRGPESLWLFRPDKGSYIRRDRRVGEWQESRTEARRWRSPSTTSS
jgi:hypothetical protein